MSATNRGTERNDADFYPTPAWVTLRLLDHVVLPGGDWLEPAAGEGHIIRAVNTARTDVRWWVRELREECGAPLRSMGLRPVFGDFLRNEARTRKRGFPVCIGNPPFSLAQEFVEKALEQADCVLFLLRLAFLESTKREHFFKKLGVPDVLVIPERVSFTGDGKTDSTAYAWMRWRRDGTQEGRVSILYDVRQRGLFDAEGA